MLHMLLTILLNYFEYLKIQNKNKIPKSIEMKITANDIYDQFQT